MNHTNDLGKDKIGSLLLRLAIPAICAQVVNMLYNIVDRMYIGHIPEIGANALTGVGVAFPIIMLLSAFASLIGMGGAPRASICMGQGEEDKASQIVCNCTSCLIGLAVALTVFFLIFQEKLLLLFGASAETLSYGTSYLTIYLLGTIFVMLALGLNGFISAQGFATTSMLTTVIGAVLNIVLDPILIFGFGMGVRGAAIATVLSQAVSAIWVVKFLAGKKTRLRLQKKYMKPSLPVMLPVIALGASPFVMQATESLLNITFNISLQKFGGDTAVGAMTILASIMQLLTMPMMGLCAGAQPIIGYNFGAKQPARMRQTVKLTVLAAFGYSMLFWLAAMLLPGTLASFFTSDAALKAFTVWAMRIYFATAFVLAFQHSLQQTFIALGEAKISLFLALLRKVILLIPMILILPAFFENKVLGVFIAEPISDFISATVVVILFRKRFAQVLGRLENPIESRKTDRI